MWRRVLATVRRRSCASAQRVLLTTARRQCSRRVCARRPPALATHAQAPRALVRLLLNRRDDYLRFTTDARVPSGNNAAEREIRMSKLRIKVSGCMRSMAGAEAFCAIRSYLSTRSQARHREA